MKILVAGGTGLVGTELLKILAQRPDHQVTVLVRSIPSRSTDAKQIEYRLFDYDNAADRERLTTEVFDVVFCALGTTRKKAGSAEQFVKVDFEYPKRLVDAVVRCNPVFCLVSSVGADEPRGLYLRTKAALEDYIFKSGLRYVILRPSLLLGERTEFRFGEWLAAKFSLPLQNIMRSKLGEKCAHYAPIAATEVAHAMVHMALEQPPQQGGVILQGRQLLNEQKTM